MEYPAQGQEGSEHHLCLLDGSVPNDSVPHMVGGGSRLYSLLWPKCIAIFYLTDAVGGPVAQETSLILRLLMYLGPSHALILGRPSPLGRRFSEIRHPHALGSYFPH